MSDDKPDVVALLENWRRRFAEQNMVGLVEVCELARDEIVALRERLLALQKHRDDLYNRWHDASAEIVALRLRVYPVPKMPAWCLQPESDTPGLFIQCQTVEQRAAIIRALKDKRDDAGQS